jgi:hypothetical protein
VQPALPRKRFIDARNYIDAHGRSFRIAVILARMIRPAGA